MRSIELADAREARKPIPKTIVRTPLFRLELEPDYPDIHLKLKNLQPSMPTRRQKKPFFNEAG